MNVVLGLGPKAQWGLLGMDTLEADEGQRRHISKFAVAAHINAVVGSRGLWTHFMGIATLAMSAQSLSELFEQMPHWIEATGAHTIEFLRQNSLLTERALRKKASARRS